jgi:hypothetical protein
MNRLVANNCKKLLKLTPINEYQQIIRMLKNAKPIYMSRGYNSNNNDVHRIDNSKNNLRKRSNKSSSPLDSIQPLKVEFKVDTSDNLGEEICGKLNQGIEIIEIIRHLNSFNFLKDAVHSILISFQLAPEMKKMAQEVKISCKISYSLGRHE